MHNITYWGTLIVFSAMMSVICSLPDIYALAKNPERWVPVNSPPWMIGDDYHYFSILNLLHRKMLNSLFGYEYKTMPFALFHYFLMVGHVFNLIPFHIGYLLRDRRYGVLFVRLWNSFWLLFGLLVLSRFWLLQLHTDVTPAMLCSVVIIYFICYPGPIGYLFINSILANFYKDKHIYKYSQANDLLRALHMGTTATLMVWATIYLVNVFCGAPITTFAFVLLCLVSGLLFFVYFPVAIVFNSMYCALLYINHDYFLCGLWSITCIVISFTYLYVLRYDTVSKEFFAHSDGGRFFNMNKLFIANTLLVLLFPTSLFMLFKYGPIPRTFILIYVISSVYSVSCMLYKHQGNRFWVRGSVVIYQLCVIVSICALFYAIVPKEIDNLAEILCPFLLIVLAIYFYRNSKQLFTIGATLAPEWIDMDLITRRRDRIIKSKIIATDSIELGYYFPLYTGDHSLLNNYSIQNLGYKEHLKEILLNFLLCGYQKQDICGFFRVETSYEHWVDDRTDIIHRPDFAYHAYMHTLRYMMCNLEYNQAVIDDGMFQNGKWTEKMLNFISVTIDSVILNLETVDAVILSPNNLKTNIGINA